MGHHKGSPLLLLSDCLDRHLTLALVDTYLSFKSSHGKQKQLLDFLFKRKSQGLWLGYDEAQVFPLKHSIASILSWNIPSNNSITIGLVWHLVVTHPSWNSSSLASDSWRRTPWATAFCIFLSILWISQSNITQIKWSCTISNCRRKGQFENVQNFFWRCFLNWEIAETKVERVLRDTL